MSVRIRPRKPNEELPYWFDNTKLVAVNTCPTWGVVRYGHGKTPFLPKAARAMPLEAGSALHLVFATARLADMFENGATWYAKEVYDLDKLHGFARSILKDGPWEEAWRYLSREGPWEQRIRDACLSVLETSGFEDDASDKRRTLANMEECTFVYLDRYEWGRWMPVWINTPHGELIGVETPFDLVVESTEELGEDRVQNVTQLRPKTARRFVGRIDGLCFDRIHKAYTVCENKTASRLDDAWHSQWQLANQVTGYCLAGETLLNNSAPVNDAVIFGLALPLPRTYDYGGCVRVPVTRSNQQRAEWFSWFAHTADLFEEYMPRPADAPHYTHSCSRYFRPCSLLSFCSMPYHERVAMLDEMHVDMWNPLAESEEKT